MPDLPLPLPQPQPQTLPGRVLAIDPGERWIGLALSDDERRSGLPLTTIDRKSLRRPDPKQHPKQHPKEHEALAIAAAIRDALGPDLPNIVIVGLPLRPDGSADAQADAFRALGERIATALGLPAALQSERRSNPAEVPRIDPRSSKRSRQAGAANPAKKRREREKRHALAAATILQRWLDAQIAPGLSDPLPPP